MHYFEPARVNQQILAGLEELIPLAPLHQPHNLAPIKIVLERMPNVPQVACFDTGFHHTNPRLAQMFALPKDLTEAGIRRYGFHGLSYEYIASVLPQRAPHAATGKTIVLHLGNGSSMCALDAGKSVASTMGFTALDGLPMGTRCGALDPGVILYLLDNKKMDPRAIEKLLYSQSGLLGVSGISSDVRELLDSPSAEAKLALDLYVYRIGRELGSLAAALGGVDAIVFTAGIGENAVSIRERVCHDAAWLGIELDAAANRKLRHSGLISSRQSSVAAWVLSTNEELMIARHTERVLGLAESTHEPALAA
jgi:acetate kinase